LNQIIFTFHQIHEFFTFFIIILKTIGKATEIDELKKDKFLPQRKIFTADQKSDRKIQPKQTEPPKIESILPKNMRSIFPILPKMLEFLHQ
jgi:hypothetical protein